MRIFRIIISALALAFTPLAVVSLVVAPVLLTGCQSSPSSYKTLAAVGGTVDVAMRTFSDLAVAGQVSPQNQAKVRELHGRYQPLFNHAVRVARFNLQSAAPEEVGLLAAELAALILSLTVE